MDRPGFTDRFGAIQPGTVFSKDTNGNQERKDTDNEEKDQSMTDSAEVIRINNLYKIFGPDPKDALKMLGKGAAKDTIYAKTGNTVAVQNANFSIRKKEMFVIMGLSGSGKSTLVRMLNRLIEPASGQVQIGGEEITRMTKKELIRLRRKK